MILLLKYYYQYFILTLMILKDDGNVLLKVRYMSKKYIYNFLILRKV